MPQKICVVVTEREMERGEVCLSVLDILGYEIPLRSETESHPKPELAQSQRRRAIRKMMRDIEGYLIDNQEAGGPIVDRLEITLSS